MFDIIFLKAKLWFYFIIFFLIKRVIFFIKVNLLIDIMIYKKKNIFCKGFINLMEKSSECFKELNPDEIIKKYLNLLRI